MRQFWAIGFVLSCLVLPSLSYSDQSYSDESKMAEYQMKALFLYNFANFVDWPNGAFKSRSEKITMCLYGDVPFGEFLDAVDGTLIGDRELTLRRTTEFSDIKNGCHILFVGEDQKVRLPTFWDEIKYIYVLSIGEEQGFAERGGIVNIMRTTDQVQFEINVSNAIKNGLFIGSDILSLARDIKRNTQPTKEP
jgi:hypothetical protein